MINLTNHSCYHCQGKSRYERSIHGYAVEAVRRAQRKVSEALDNRDLNMISWTKQEEQRAIRRLYQVESDLRHGGYKYVSRYNHHHGK